LLMICCSLNNMRSSRPICSTCPGNQVQEEGSRGRGCNPSGGSCTLQGRPC
jgi:hypothetical protein